MQIRSGRIHSDFDIEALAAVVVAPNQCFDLLLVYDLRDAALKIFHNALNVSHLLSLIISFYIRP